MCYIYARRILYFWLFGFVIFYGTIGVILHVYKHQFNTLIDTNNNNNQLIGSFYSILACLMLINVSLAIGTFKIGKCFLMIIFIIVSLMIFIGEMLFLIKVYQYRENVFLGYQMIDKFIKNLVKVYNTCEIGRFILDHIHIYFDCCGYDEWHHEWINISRQISKNDTSQLIIDHWVPNSCCKKIYQSDKFCGYAIYHTFINNDYFIKLRESYQPIYIPNKWYIKLNNDPCPELIYIWLGEIPVYLLMFGLMVIVARILYTIYAILDFAKTKK
ncbi:unnamed protein product [Schistosoma rodhaini]|nr:unnamed protein product [Schistosoma rodhaini]